jgi:Fe-S-cluster containining protein
VLDIESIPGTEDGLLPNRVREELQSIYDRVPAISCGCDQPGWCCELTEEEREEDFATMYPLYWAEYLNIADYVDARFGAERREELHGLRDERPDRCPFLSDEGECTIYPVRPMVCRTYGVLSREQVEETAKEVRGSLPDRWINAFLDTEIHSTCKKTRVLEPEKSPAHAEAMVAFTYERDLIRLGKRAWKLEEPRQEILRKVAERAQLRRWSWGGFNTLTRSPLKWLKRHFKGYWKKSILPD